MTERDIQNEIKAVCESLGCLVVRHQSQGNIIGGRKVRKGNNGIWDLYGLTPYGRFFSIECKAPGSSTERAHRLRQEAWRDEVLSRQGIAIITDDPKEVEAILAAVIEQDGGQ